MQPYNFPFHNHTWWQAIFWHSISEILIYCSALIVSTAFQVNHESPVTTNPSMGNVAPSNKFVMAICMKGFEHSLQYTDIKLQAHWHGTYQKRKYTEQGYCYSTITRVIISRVSFASNTFFLPDPLQWNVQVLRSTMVKVRCSYIVGFSRYSCFYRSRPVKHHVL